MEILALFGVILAFLALVLPGSPVWFLPVAVILIGLSVLLAGFWSAGRLWKR